MTQVREKADPEFDRYAHSYAELLEDPIRSRFSKDPVHFHRRKWFLLEKILKSSGLDASRQKWLDVGCGRGELLALAGAHFAQATGCDPSANMLSALSTFPVRQQTSPTELPFADGSADLVTAVCVYHHVHGTERTLLTDEIRRVLRPGGLCCIMEHNPWNPVTRAIVRRCPVDIDAELLTAHSAGTLLLNAGFEIIRTDYFLYFPERLWASLGVLEEALRGIPFGGQYALLARALA